MRNTERPVVDDPVLRRILTTMEEKGRRILTTMEEKGVNQQDVTKHLGLGNGAFTRWKYNNGKSYMQYLNRIAEFLGVSREYLLSGKEEIVENEKLSSNEKKLLEAFRNLKKIEQDIFLRQLIGFSTLTNP